MNEFPDCVCVVNYINHEFVLEDNHYEETLDEYIENLQNSNTPVLIEKSRVLESIENSKKWCAKDYCGEYEDISWRYRYPDYAINDWGQTYVFRETRTCHSENGKYDYKYNFVLTVNKPPKPEPPGNPREQPPKSSPLPPHRITTTGTTRTRNDKKTLYKKITENANEPDCEFKGEPKSKILSKLYRQISGFFQA